MIKLTLTEATVTRYNDKAEDWSGETLSVAPELITEEGTTLYKAFNSLLDNHFYGADLEAALPELWANLLDNADGCTSVVSYAGEDDGRYNENGRYLVDLFVYVEKVEPVDILGWNY